MNTPRSKDPWDNISGRSVVWIGLALALAFELLTCLFRFGFGFESTRDTGWLSAITFGFRIHHGYLGLLLAFIAVVCFPKRNGYRNILLVLATALVASDLAHHFLVLWPITGSPQFDLTYPK